MFEQSCLARDGAGLALDTREMIRLNQQLDHALSHSVAIKLINGLANQPEEALAIRASPATDVSAALRDESATCFD